MGGDQKTTGFGGPVSVLKPQSPHGFRTAHCVRPAKTRVLTQSGVLRCVSAFPVLTDVQSLDLLIDTDPEADQGIE